MRAWLFVALTLASACGKREPEPKPRTEPWENPAYAGSARPSSSASAGAAVASERLPLRASDVRFTLPAKQRTTHGKLGSASGELTLARAALEQTRGVVSFDLTALTIDAEGDGDGGDQRAWTGRALEWLELGAEVAPGVRERHRTATFTLTDVTDLTPGKTPDQWLGTAQGQLALHGFRVPVEQPVEVELSIDKVLVRSRRPMVVKLAEHDLRPRNSEGRVVASELSLLGTTVGREAKVEFQLVFGPAVAEPKAEQD